MSIHKGSRQILFHGLFLIFAGLLWGLVVPLTPFPRLALVAHVQFEVNGMLFLIQALLLLTLRHQVGPKSMRAMTVAPYFTWIMILSQVANSWWGTMQTLPIAGSQAGATGGNEWQEMIVLVAHVLGALTIILAWSLLIVGFFKEPDNKKAS